MACRKNLVDATSPQSDHATQHPDSGVYLVLERMLAAVFSVVCLLALRGLAALVCAAASLECLAFIVGRMRLRAGFVIALPGFQGSLGSGVR